MPGMSVRIISQASTEPRGHRHQHREEAADKGVFQRPHSTAFAMVPVRMYFQ